MKSVVLAVGAVLGYAIFSYLSGLRRNINAAKKSGLPYVVAPCSPIFLPWQITHKLWIPIIKRLPTTWWEEWLDLLTPGYSYRTRHSRFARTGDAFFIVSPAMMYLMLANAEAITQVTTRRDHFPKYTETYSILRQFGENVLTSEGPVWRMHRKVTSASFNERNAALVFRESIRQTHGMVASWLKPGEGASGTIRTLETDTMRLALNIISYAGFGLRLLWPGQTLPEGSDPKLAKYASLEASPGYKLSFVDTLAILLEHILLLLLLPSWLLRALPFKRTRLAADAYHDYKKYVDELLDEKIDEARKDGQRGEGMDIMGQLVQSSYVVQGDSRAAQQPRLSREDIIGNAFIMMVAGHETTANAMHFSLLELATNPASQRRLQREIDELLGDKDPEAWDYEALVGPLAGGMVGASLNETLRLFPAVVEIPKKVTPGQDQVLTIDGRSHVIPRNTVIALVSVSVQRNPRYWPSRPSKVEPGKNDLDDYVPERWFRTTTGEEANAATDADADEEDFGGYAGPDTSAAFRPARGAYIPFSDGARSCLGRRVAQVKVMAALAVVFRGYSVELAVDELASDEEVARMSREKRAALYKTAQESSRRTLDGATSVVTLKLHGAHVPVRVVRRGEERFVDWVDGE